MKKAFLQVLETYSGSSNQDNHGTEESVPIREGSSFQGLNCTQTWDLVQQKCPVYQAALISGSLYIQCTYTPINPWSISMEKHVYSTPAKKEKTETQNKTTLNKPNHTHKTYNTQQTSTETGRCMYIYGAGHT